jgi:hypothetical protein
MKKENLGIIIYKFETLVTWKNKIKTSSYCWESMIHYNYMKKKKNIIMAFLQEYWPGKGLRLREMVEWVRRGSDLLKQPKPGKIDPNH